MNEDLRQRLQPALDAYSAALAAHGREYDSGRHTCTCGWTPRNGNPSRSLGLHIGAAHRRAGRAYDAAAAAAIAEVTR